MAAYYGFFKWKGFGPPTNFVGFDNYLIIFKDAAFHDALRAQRLHRGAVAGHPGTGRRRRWRCC